jgi:hypothetical protein
VKVDDWHRECGMHSGIPECCIDWYVGPWKDVVLTIPYLWEAYWKANNRDDEVDYIRCPMCIEHSIVAIIKECDCHESR